MHERSLDSDFGLALALDAQAALRPDLRLLAMSATLDGARFAALMGGGAGDRERGPQLPDRASPSRPLGRENGSRTRWRAAIRRALGEAEGSLLAFLPGVAEIERTAERLDRLPPDVDLHRLHGSLDPAEQRAAIAAPAPGRRKIVLATCDRRDQPDARRRADRRRQRPRPPPALRPRRRPDPARHRAGRARPPSTQRAGRAGRQGPGIVYRLWEEAATAALPRFDPPEILEADLSALVLDCALWGVADPRRLRWLDPPPAAAVEEARKRLLALGAIDAQGRPTAHGRAIAEAAAPAPARAHADRGRRRAAGADIAAEVAVLLSERGLGGNEPIWS